MNKTRTRIKKIIYNLFGESVYAKAYARGKIKDIKNDTMSEAEFSFMNHFLAKNSTVLDIGANYGHYAVELAKRCPEGEIHAFEPIPFTFRVLERVCSHFKCSNIHCYNAAVSDEEGFIEMTLPLLDFGAPNTGIAYVGDQSETASKPIRVAKLKIDALNFKQKIDFVKIDIEGHEPSAFKGMESLLLTDQPIILIEFSHPCLNRAGTQPQAFAATIRDEYSYQFAALNDSKLHLIKDKTPNDGYYFLIPNAKMETYQSLISS